MIWLKVDEAIRIMNTMVVTTRVPSIDLHDHPPVQHAEGGGQHQHADDAEGGRLRRGGDADQDQPDDAEEDQAERQDVDRGEQDLGAEARSGSTS